MCSGSEAGSYSKLIDSRITQLKAQGPSKPCQESKDEVSISTLAPHPRQYLQAVQKKSKEEKEGASGFGSQGMYVKYILPYLS